MREATEEPYLDATITPHRSLNWRQAAFMLKIIAAIFLIMGLVFATVGAWPVIIFGVVELTLVYLAFVWNFRDQKFVEQIIIDQTGFHLIRTNPKGKIQRHDLEAYWMQVAIQRPRPQDYKLTVTTHGKSLAIADDLNGDEKQDLAKAIEKALMQYRNGQRLPS